MKKKMKKKPYRSVFSNAVWAFRHQLKFAPKSFLLLMTGIPLAVVQSYMGILLPSLVVKEVTAGSSLAKAALTIGLIMLSVFLCKMLTEAFSCMQGGYLSNYRWSISEMIDRKALGCFYQQIEKKEVRDLYDRASKTTQMWNGVQPISDMPEHTAELIKNVLCYLLFGSVVSLVHPLLVPILTVAPIVNWMCVRAYNKWEYANRDKWTDTSRKLWYVQTKPADFAAGKDIRIYGMTDWFTDMFQSLNREYAVWDRQRVGRKFLSGIANLVIILIRDGAAYALLIAMTLRGEITVDEFVLYFAAISSFAGFIGRILGSWNHLHSTSLSLCDLREFLNLPEYDGTGEEQITEHLKHAPEITFDHVSFRYDGAETDTLHEISFTVKAGERIALVGLNGAGKTTVVKLLCGLYTPTSGEIRLNGIPLSKFLRKDYYKLFSPVFQNIQTSYFSLGETVSGVVGNHYDRERAEFCMRRAGLGEKLDSLSMGLDTKLDKQVNENAIELSGGELQKMMLARALYKDAPMLVLDEPTAALDPIAENEIYQQYQSMASGKSAVFISHRLASTRFCDRILYLENGRIAEEGTHDVLMSKKGRYAELFDIQSCWYRDDFGKENVK
ncbi:MAG: ABC transporter ATP-binding protein [Clostridia bacterium]|nr:ABC transporter ATP-binding protein [Clostridia bacterium]